MFLLVGYSYQYVLSKTYSSEDQSSNDDLAVKSGFRSYDDSLSEEFDEIKHKLTLILSKREIELLTLLMRNSELVKRDSTEKRPFNPQTSKFKLNFAKNEFLNLRMGKKITNSWI